MRYQIEIDAPVILGVEAENEDEAERLGDTAYEFLWTAMYNAVEKLAEETNTDAHLGARYDDTSVTEKQ